jgi:HTH-type transcriptional regulator/antitoxin HigA
MDIRPIRNEEDRRAALQEIERLWNAEPGTDDGDKLDILATLVERYEDTRWPVSKTRNDPIDMLHFLIDECGHTQAELGDLLCSRPRASEILNRKRALTVEMIYKISKAWKVPAEILIKPYQLKVA